MSKPENIGTFPPVGGVPLPFLTGGTNNLKIIADLEKELSSRQEAIANLEAQVNNLQNQLENARIAEQNKENEVNELNKQINKLQRKKERRDKRIAANKETIEKQKIEIAQLNEENRILEEKAENNKANPSIEESEVIKRMMTSYTCSCSNLESLAKKLKEEEEQALAQKKEEQQNVIFESVVPNLSTNKSSVINKNINLNLKK